MGKFKDIENIICSPIDSDEKTFNTTCNVVNTEGPIIETELAKYYLYGIGCEKNEAMFLKYINIFFSWRKIKYSYLLCILRPSVWKSRCLFC